MTGLVVPKPSFMVPKSAVPTERWKAPGAGKHLVGFVTDAPVPPDVPAPVGYRIIVQVFEAKDKTESGLVLAQVTRDAEKTLAMLGRVVAVGSDAYSDSEKFPSGPWCKVGDIVMLSLYTGHKFAVHGVAMRSVNDDEILAVVPDPNAISRA